jgi:hypothetical protein
VLQLSNERNFGFERDWYAGFWGTINKHLNYDAYYLTGSGYDLKYKGQKGLGAIQHHMGVYYIRASLICQCKTARKRSPGFRLRSPRP